MDNITYFNEIAHQETDGEIPKIAQDGMTEEFHTYKEALGNHISMISMSSADREILIRLIDWYADAAETSGFIKGFLAGHES